jgi:uncharacterized protein
MPLIERSSYPGPPLYQFNGHLQTIIPALKNGNRAPYERERLILPDGDFLDLDWIDRGSDHLLLLTHGLEGDSKRYYMQRMACFFARRGWDVLAWNCRSCSGEMNRSLRMYHHGETEDIGEVVNHVIRTKNYKNILLVGFSMGGSISLKYLGVMGKEVPEPIRGGVAFSSPFDLRASISAVEKPGNQIYHRRFIKSLLKKMKVKAEQFPDRIDPENVEKVTCWREFDDWFSAPINGYADAEDFYDNASAKNFIQGIQRPAVLVNAQNDPIIPEACSPVAEARRHPYFYVERPTKGGHVGFELPGRKVSWMELRVWAFWQQIRDQH